MDTSLFVFQVLGAIMEKLKTQQQIHLEINSRWDFKQKWFSSHCVVD